MAKFECGKFSVEIDPTDVEFVKKYEDAADEYNAEIAKISKVGKVSEQLEYICNVFFKVFDTIFGVGTHNKMFGDKLSVRDCAEAFRKLVDVIKSENLNDTLGIVSGENRAVRRAKSKGKAAK